MSLHANGAAAMILECLMKLVLEVVIGHNTPGVAKAPVALEGQGLQQGDLIEGQ